MEQTTRIQLRQTVDVDDVHDVCIGAHTNDTHHIHIGIHERDFRFLFEIFNTHIYMQTRPQHVTQNQFRV